LLPGRRPQLLAALVLGGIFAYPLLLGIPLLDPDEGLHASIAQEMVEGGDWLVPRLLGHAFWDKPILYFWVQAVSLRWLGMHEAAVRLPGLLFGLLGVWSTAWLGRELFNPRAGFLAGLCYATTVLPASLVQAAVHDVALVLWTNLALLALWKMQHRAHSFSRSKYMLAAGVVLGLSVLTKGLVGVALVGIAFGVYLLATGQLRWWHCVLGAGVLLVAAAVAAPWYLAMEVRNPGYLHYFFIQRHFQGYLSSAQWHGRQPWWYYLPVVLGGGLPWICYLPAAGLEHALRRFGPTAERSACSRGFLQGMALLWCWLVGGIVFFSLAKAKLVTYLWPVFPAVALLAAAVWERLLCDRLARLSRQAMALTLVTTSFIGPVALPAAMGVVEHKFGFRLGPVAYALGLPVAFSGWLVLYFWWRGRPWHSLSTAFVSLALHLAFVMTVVIPPLSRTVTAQPLAEFFNAQGTLPPRMVFVQGRVGSFVFYLHPALREQLRRRPPERKLLCELPSPLPKETVFIVPERYVAAFRKHPGGCPLCGCPMGWLWVFRSRSRPPDSPAAAVSTAQGPLSAGDARTK